MDLEFTGDQDELRDSIRAFLEKECPTELVRDVVETGKAADDLWSAMVALDWPALAIPEEDGGIGLSFVETAIVAEELGRVVAPGPLLATMTQFAPVVREVGTAQQRQRFLGAVASGASTGSLAIADQPRYCGLEQVTTRAVPDGDAWVLNGTKYGVLGGPATDEFVVLAAAGDGLGAFVVSGADLEISPLTSLDATRPISVISIDAVRVEGDRALGEPGTPASLVGIERAVQEATVALALETVGTCDALFQMVLAYVKDRHQFGVPVGSFQAIKHKMVDMFVSLERARSLCYFAVAAIDEDDAARARAVAMAKAASDDCQREICQEAFQSFGGIGFTWEHDSHLFMKRAKTDGALFGGSGFHGTAAARLSNTAVF